LDVDDFKAFNDNLGHAAGDRVLQTVADQLKLMTDKVGIVGRSGGDEFMVVLPDHSGGDAEAFIEAFQDWLSLGAPAVNGMFRVNVSGGYAVFPQDAHDRQELLAAADARLYKAKHRAQRLRPHYAGAGDEAAPSLGVYGLLDRILSSIDVRDSYTRLHCEKTAEYAIILAQQLGLSPSAQRTLRLAALLHDVGKVGIPDGILRKPGPLSAEEFEVIKHHISIADHLIVDIPNADEVRKLVRSHHERWDGGGYPQGLKDEEIPYLARILSVADAFSAITLDRPYRRRLPDDEACAELERAAGTQLDPDLVRSFSETVRRLAGESVPQDLATPAA
jgi:diguanylate cyclase (GGDEF)-like protein